MSYYSNIAIKIENQDKVNKDSFLEFLKYLIGIGLCDFNGNTKLAFYEWDEPVADIDDEYDAIEEYENLNGDTQANDFIDKYGLVGASFYSFVTDGEESENKKIINFFEQVGSHLASLELEESQGKLYWESDSNLGFENPTGSISGESYGWQFYVRSGGYLNDTSELERAFMNGFPIFRDIRKKMEEIFQSDTNIGCFIIG